MKTKIFSFTDNGSALAKIIADKLEDCSIAVDKFELEGAFLSSDCIIFVGATGIAVRLIAPFIKDKLKDPAVIVIDERGQFVIPLLSGHVGRANEYAKKLSEIIGAVPVITTATDVNGIIAVDEFASVNGLEIVNRDNIKKVSSGLLKGFPKNIAIADDVVITSDYSDIDKEVLGLMYRPLVVGIGLRRDKDFESLERFFLDTLSELSCDIKHVAGLCSIDVKSDEKALLELSEKYNIPLFFFSAKELDAVEGDFEESAFVKETVGVADVSARAAKALGKRGNFILKKKKENGMTISVFEKYRRITFEY